MTYITESIKTIYSACEKPLFNFIADYPYLTLIAGTAAIFWASTASVTHGVPAAVAGTFAFAASVGLFVFEAFACKMVEFAKNSTLEGKNR